MTELKIINMDKNPFNKKLFEDEYFKSKGINIELDAVECGYDISKADDNNTHIYGYYSFDDDIMYTLYPGRCTGNWLELLNLIDEYNPIPIYHEDFDIYWEHESQKDSVEEIAKKLTEAVDDCREKLNLKQKNFNFEITKC
jgi:hypothetical protein